MERRERGEGDLQIWMGREGKWEAGAKRKRGGGERSECGKREGRRKEIGKEKEERNWTGEGRGRERWGDGRREWFGCWRFTSPTVISGRERDRQTDRQERKVCFI